MVAAVVGSELIGESCASFVDSVATVTPPARCLPTYAPVGGSGALSNLVVVPVGSGELAVGLFPVATAAGNVIEVRVTGVCKCVVSGAGFDSVVAVFFGAVFTADGVGEALSVLGVTPAAGAIGEVDSAEVEPVAPGAVVTVELVVLTTSGLACAAPWPRVQAPAIAAPTPVAFAAFIQPRLISIKHSVDLASAGITIGTVGAT